MDNQTFNDIKPTSKAESKDEKPVGNQPKEELPVSAPTIGDEPVDAKPILAEPPETDKILDQEAATNVGDTPELQKEEVKEAPVGTTHSDHELSTSSSEPHVNTLPSKGSKKILITLVVVLAVALVSAAIFLYLSKGKTTTTKTTSSQPTTSQPAPQVTASDVNKTSQAADESLKAADDAADINTDLSDTALQL